MRRVRLSTLGDRLEKITAVVDFESFRVLLDRLLARPVQQGQGGCLSYDPVVMVKIVVIQQWWTIADDHTDYQVNDRVSFHRFLGLTVADKVPDATMIWGFRDQVGVQGGTTHRVRAGVGRGGARHVCGFDRGRDVRGCATTVEHSGGECGHHSRVGPPQGGTGRMGHHGTGVVRKTSK